MVSQKQYATNNKDDIKEYKAGYYQENKDWISKEGKEYRALEENKKRKAEYDREYVRKRLETDINFKLARNLRKRINHIVGDGQKAGSAINDLGCSVEELIRHLEFKFYTNPKTEEQMSWDNYGIRWHIDHVIPLATLELTDENGFCRACHYTNLQPLWAEDNLSKGDSLIWDWE